MLKIGFVGAGALGKIHINCLKEIKDFDLIGFYDSDSIQAKKIAKELNIKLFESLDELLNEVDVVDIINPNFSNYECAVKAIRKSKHVFVDKPIINSNGESKNLMELAHEANVKVQIGNSERFSSAYKNALPYFSNPMYIESNSLAEFKNTDKNNSVVFDLMIHDIYIVLSIIKSTVKKISATGVSVISNNPDIVNARIEFDNGCVANLTSSRISLKNRHKTRIFQKELCLTIDFFRKETRIVRFHENDEKIDKTNNADGLEHLFENPGIQNESIKCEQENTIKNELESFYNCIVNNTNPEVTIEDGYNAMNIAQQIIEKIKLTTNLLEFDNKAY